MTVTVEGNIIKLYGTIWFGDSDFIVQKLQPVLDKYTDVELHLHTPGGSVFDGNMIYNTLINSKANITTIIDGLCASMGTIIMLAGSQINMRENAFVMIHAPSGGCWGGARDMENTAKLLRSIEKNFVKKYAAKTGRKETEVAKWMEGDNWFSAEEALKEGIIDSIIDNVFEDVDLSALMALKPAALMGNFPDPVTAMVTPTDTQTIQTDDMKLSAKNLTVLGLEQTASENDVNAAIEVLSKRAEKAEKEAKEAKDNLAAIEKENEKELEARIESLVGGAVKDGRITADKKEQYIAMAKSNYSLAEGVLADMKPRQALHVQADPASGAKGERADWDFNKWRKEDPAGLIAMKKDNPEGYKALKR